MREGLGRGDKRRRDRTEGRKSIVYNIIIVYV